MDRDEILNDHVRKMVETGILKTVLFGLESGHRQLRGIPYQMALRPRVIAADIVVRIALLFRR